MDWILGRMLERSSCGALFGNDKICDLDLEVNYMGHVRDTPPHFQLLLEFDRGVYWPPHFSALVSTGFWGGCRRDQDSGHRLGMSRSLTLISQMMQSSLQRC